MPVVDSGAVSDPVSSIDAPRSTPSARSATTAAIRRARLIRAWTALHAQDERRQPLMVRGYDPRYARPDITHECALAEAAAAAAMAEMDRRVD